MYLETMRNKKVCWVSSSIKAHEIKGCILFAILFDNFRKKRSAPGKKIKCGNISTMLSTRPKENEDIHS